MKVFNSIFKMLFWMVVAYIPVYWWRFERVYSEAIGCPKSGDCYVPGSEHLLTIEKGIFLSAAILWPLAFWKILDVLSEFMKQTGLGRKKSGKHESKSGGAYRSPEEFHADFEKRYAKPGRIPEDVA
jgi:hypothetical protein